MKKIALITYAKIITTLLSIVGYLTGCHIIDDPKDEYGVPSADYVIKGKVTDAITNQPIKSMHIIRESNCYAPRENDTIRSASDGTYEMKFNEYQHKEIKIYADDLDEIENGGKYATDTIRIKISDLKQIKERRGWNIGTFEKTNADFKLKHKTNAMYGVLSTEYKEIKKIGK